jgi:Na+/phosphate symporter
MFRENETFSDAANGELKALLARTIRFVTDSVGFVNDDSTESVEKLLSDAEAIREAADEIRVAHLARVQTGVCDALPGMAFSDMIVALRRIKNHSVNLLDAKVSRWEERREALRVLDVNRGDDAVRLRNSINPEPQA